MFGAVCVLLRVMGLVSIGLLAFREFLPGAVNVDVHTQTSISLPSPITDRMRYERGEMGWADFRDDVDAIKKKMESCVGISSANTTSWTECLGCSFQALKENTKYRILLCLKNVCQCAIRTFRYNVNALRNPSMKVAIFAVLRLSFHFAMMCLLGVKSYQHRGWISAKLRAFVTRAYDYIFPMSTPVPVVTQPYVSDAAQLVLEAIRNADDEVPVDVADLMTAKLIYRYLHRQNAHNLAAFRAEMVPGNNPSAAGFRAEMFRGNNAAAFRGNNVALIAKAGKTSRKARKH